MTGRKKADTTVKQAHTTEGGCSTECDQLTEGTWQAVLLAAPASLTGAAGTCSKHAPWLADWVRESSGTSLLRSLAAHRGGCRPGHMGPSQLPSRPGRPRRSFRLISHTGRRHLLLRLGRPVIQWCICWFRFPAIPVQSKALLPLLRCLPPVYFVCPSGRMVIPDFCHLEHIS